MSAQIHNARNVTPEFILEEACSMWKEVEASGVDKIDEIIPKYRDLCTSYPVILRYMMMSEFSRHAMKKFLRYVELNPWKSVDEFIECQTMYVVYLYKERHPHYNSAHVKALKVNTRQILKQEHEDFENLGKKITDDVEKTEEDLKKQAKDKLKVFFAIHGEETVNVPLRVATEIDNRVPTLPSIVIESIPQIYTSDELFN
jgi:hypothetical protein